MARARTKRAEAAIRLLEVPEGIDPIEILEALEDGDVLANIADAPGSRHGFLIAALADKIAHASGLSPKTVQASVRKAIQELRHDTEGSDPPPDSLANLLVQYGVNDDLFLGDDGAAYAAVSHSKGVKTYSIDSEDYKDLLAHRLYEDLESTASAAALSEAVRTLRAQAKHSNLPPRKVHLRYHFDGTDLWYDLATDSNEVVRISASGWRVEARAPVHFVRFRSTAAQCIPVRGGSVDDLDQFIHATKRNKALLKAYIVTGYFDNFPRYAACFGGPQGSTKTTMTRFVREVLDPSIALTTNLHRCLEDLAIQASRNAVVAIDNLSQLSGDISDMLCQLVTGGAFARRSKYTDSEETIWRFRRVVLLGGIGAVIKRPDLLDRTLLFRLKAIPDTKRLKEELLWERFQAAKPAILGAFFDVLSGVLRHRDSIDTADSYRMADAAHHMLVAGHVMGLENEVREGLAVNAEEQIADALDEEVVGHSLLDFLNEEDGFCNTATELLRQLDSRYEHLTKSKGWPKTGIAMGTRVTRLEVVLNRVGWIVDRESRKPGSGARILEIRRRDDQTSRPGSRRRARREDR